LRVLKPGGHLLAFGGTRTYHRMACAVEDAGFEVRDCLMWLYGSGFPKSLDVSKAIDKKLGAERVVIAEGKPVKRMIPGADQNKTGSWIKDNGRVFVPTVTAPATPQAKQWEGWGTALKPAVEPIILARKPLSEATVAENVLKWGTGGLNIDGCRVPLAYGEEITMRSDAALLGGRDLGWDRPWKRDPDAIARRRERAKAAIDKANILGRWPANVLLDEEAAAMLDEQQGGASRFFYVAKASRSERTMGGKVENNHPTVKPIKLMRYLCRLITPPGGTVLDPFAGSGTTILAAVQEGFSAIGIEREPEYCEIIRKRMAAVQETLPLRA